MTRKHFIKIAAIVAANKSDSTRAEYRRLLLAQELNNYFRQVNSNFNEGKFLAACELT